MFELDRFELVEGQRYEVEGRWSGVRGRVFIRPELTLSDGNQRRRLLADLAQKPWQAADGDPWAVVFPCAGHAIAAIDAELTVAPDITVAVKRGRTRRTRAGQRGAPRTSLSQPQAAGKPRAEAEPKTDAGGKRRGLGVQLAETRSQLEQVRNEQQQLYDRLDAAMRRSEEARAAREDATQLREQLAAERDDAIRARDEAIAELGQARSDLERARETLQATVAERDSAIRAGIEVERELHAATTERNNLLKDREQLLAQQDWLHGELKQLAAARTETHGDEQHPAEQRQPVLPAQPPAFPNFSWSEAGGWRHSPRPQLRNRAVALLALAAAAIVVLLILVLMVF